MTHWLFKSVFFSFYIFVNFPVFLLLLSSSFIPLWLEKILGILSIFLNLLRLVTKHLLYPGECSYALEKNMYSANMATFNILITILLQIYTTRASALNEVFHLNSDAHQSTSSFWALGRTAFPSLTCSKVGPMWLGSGQ